MQKKIVIDGWPIWPLFVAPWLVGAFVIGKSVIEALV